MQDTDTGKRRVWDTDALPEESGGASAAAKGALGGHVNDSLAAFIEALQKCFELDDQPKFIVFEHAERLLPMSHATGIASNAIEAGVHDGAFLAALSRLGELVSHPNLGSSSSSY